MIMTYEEWYGRATHGTSGDMVWDILKDWKEERERLMKSLEVANELLSKKKVVLSKEQADYMMRCW